MPKTLNIVLLSAGIPFSGNAPSGFNTFSDATILDWHLKNRPEGRLHIVTGFKYEQFDRYQDTANLIFNKEWESSKSAFSLLLSTPTEGTLFASYTDIVYQQDLFHRLKQASGDIVLALDSEWQSRYVGRSSEDIDRAEKVALNSHSQVVGLARTLPTNTVSGEFVGAVVFNEAAVQALSQLKNTLGIDNFKNYNLSELIEYLRLTGLSVTGVDVKGEWAELNDPNDLAQFVLGTKAETLERLQGVISSATVLPQVYFSVAEWRANQTPLTDNVRTELGAVPLIVRSSALSEDAFAQSNAGAFTSILNVHINDGFPAAVDTVIDSYINPQDNDFVLVQPLVKDVVLSGVAFTRTLEHAGPFYIINFDEGSDTESITSGSSATHASLVVRRDAAHQELADERLRPVVNALQEIEGILNYDALDVEFAIDAQGEAFLLQVRPIAAISGVDSRELSEQVIAMQKRAAAKFEALQPSAPHIVGTKALFGVMPDWNPAEIIGTNPGKLAVTLYEYLIMDDIWATQRAEYGYRDVRPQRLMETFAGKPYVNIRGSFNSFIPASVTDEVADKLVDFYLDWLEQNPKSHDKVEFEVVPTIFGPGFPKWRERLTTAGGFSTTEIDSLQDGLLKITNDAIHRNHLDLAALQTLNLRREKVLSDATLPNSRKIAILLDDCQRYGTLPFAHLARSGFVAVTLLREGVENGLLSTNARDEFLESVSTVSKELSTDSLSVAQGVMPWEVFVNKYGHLRPGTYDITSPAYWDDPEQYLHPIVEQATTASKEVSEAAEWEKEKSTFFGELRNIGLQATDDEFEQFLRDAIEGRERSKFHFSINLSHALQLITEQGARFGMSPEELSNCSYKQLLEAFNSDEDPTDLSAGLKAAATRNQHMRQLSHACQLPPIITGTNSFSSFLLTADKPNFIGSQRITAPAVHLTGTSNQGVDVAGAIVLIPAADPGYDWLFGQNIAGLITLYGGANSHMAIRSAEFGLPAAIGVGDQLFQSLQNTKILELDPSGETIRIIS